MKRLGLSVVAALVAGALSLSGCGGGGGSSSSSPAPTPVPIPPAPVPGPTLRTLANQPPVGVYLAMLLTDGTVMAQANPTGAPGMSAGDFYRLTPDASGDYAAGTWSRLAAPPAGYAPYASAEAVLADGRVLFVGGEYNQDDYRLPFGPHGLTNMSAVFDPVANSWTMIPPPPGQDYIGDVPSTVLPDGRFVFGSKLDKRMWSLDPATLTWTAIASTGKNDNFAEEGFTQLPGGSVLTIDLTTIPQSEHFLPASSAWVQDGPTPVSLTSPTGTPGGLTFGPAPVQVVGGVTYGPGPAGIYFPPGEIGPAILRPDGTVFATGAAVAGQTAHTAIYRPGAAPGQAGSWTRGPDFPGVDDADDSSAALLTTGNVLVAGATGAFYEFDGTNFSLTAAGPANARTAVPIFLLPLPSGQVLALSPTLNVLARLYIPLGSAQPAWAPTIAAVPATLVRGQSFTLTGTQLNGLSEAAQVGDELTAATNYPLVRLTYAATGHVFYARTHDHSTMGVATGAAPVSTKFDVPAGAETGAAALVVVANGIPSASVSVTVG
ncbi:MAG: hypothetical protein JWO81_1191 [Alphaproteobacteria bacterium]|nr:hypothetical protein [Alphaproteobacteria bacterium]